MKVSELSKELEITNKELIDFLKKNEYKISSHMQSVPDETIEPAKEYFSKNNVKQSEESKKYKVEENNKVEDKNIYVNENDDSKTKTFKPDDLIPCKSVTPWKLIALGVDKVTTYHWNYYGDVDYVAYKDLQALRRTSYITKPKILIEDADLCYQWRRELKDAYKYFLGVEYPEEFFDLSDEEFERILRTTPDTLKEVMKVTATSMIKNENYPTIQKLTLIDNILGTCLKDIL